MPLFWRKKTLLAKLEGVYRTDAVPTGAADAMIAINVNLRPMEGQSVSRDIDRAFLGARGEILVDTHVQLDFEVELAGAGAAGDAPAYAPLLLASGFAETLTALTDAVYAPISETFPSVTIYLNIDGTRHAILGARGDWGVVLTPSQLPRFRFSFRGLFTTPAAATLPTADVSGFQTPVPVSDVNTPTFALHGTDLVMEAFEVSGGNDVQGRFLVNSESIEIVDRAVTAQATVEAVALATFDPYGRAAARTTGTLQVVHGTAAGQIVQIDAPVVEIGRPSIGQTQQITNWQLPLTLLPSAGNDEVTITVK